MTIKKSNHGRTFAFTVKDKSGNPLTTLTSASFNIARLVPKSGNDSYNKWVPYIQRSQEVTGSSAAAQEFCAATRRDWCRVLIFAHKFVM